MITVRRPGMSGTLYLRVLRIERVKVRCQRAGWGAVSQRFQRCELGGVVGYPGLQQPWAGIGERLRRYREPRLDMVSRDVRSVTRNASTAAVEQRAISLRGL